MPEGPFEAGLPSATRKGPPIQRLTPKLVQRAGASPVLQIDHKMSLKLFIIRNGRCFYSEKFLKCLPFHLPF